MNLHEQARAEVEKRALRVFPDKAPEVRNGYVVGFLAGHEAATTLGEPDLLDAITDPDDLRGRVRAVMRALRNIEAERDSWHQAALTATAGESRAERERDEARGKLDKVRTRLTNERARAEHDCEPDGYIDWLDATLAILDE